jgi:hypothetical protein
MKRNETTNQPTVATTATTTTNATTTNDTVEVDLLQELTKLASDNKLSIPSKGSELDSLKNSVKYATTEKVVIATIDGKKLPLIVREFTDDKGNYYLSSKPSNTFGNVNSNATFNSEEFATYLESVRDSEPTTKRTHNLSEGTLLELGTARISVNTLTKDLALFIKTKLSTPNSVIPIVKESSKEVYTTLASYEAFSNAFTNHAINVYQVGTNPLVATIQEQVSNGLLTADIANTILANQSTYTYVIELPKQTRVRRS